MARIGGFTERRQLRRAADQALMSVFAQPLAAPPSDLHLETLAGGAVLAAPNRELPPVEPEPAPAEPPEVGIPASEGERDTERDDPDATPPFGFAMPLDDVVQWAAISTIDVPPAEATALRRPFYRSPAVMGAGWRWRWRWWRSRWRPFCSSRAVIPTPDQASRLQVRPHRPPRLRPAVPHLHHRPRRRLPLHCRPSPLRRRWHLRPKHRLSPHRNIRSTRNLRAGPLRHHSRGPRSM